MSDDKPFTVMVADNFHYMDKSEYYVHGKFDTLEEAMVASKNIVERFLLSALKPGWTGDKLYENYTSFGEDPFILGTPGGDVPFSAWDYAKARCAELCS